MFFYDELYPLLKYYCFAFQYYLLHALCREGKGQCMLLDYVAMKFYAVMIHHLKQTTLPIRC